MWLLQLTAGLTTPGFEINPEEWFVTAFKILLVLGSGLYLIFAFLIIRQVQLMSRAVKTDFAPVLFVVAIIHAILALLVFLYMLGL